MSIFPCFFRMRKLHHSTLGEKVFASPFLRERVRVRVQFVSDTRLRSPHLNPLPLRKEERRNSSERNAPLIVAHGNKPRTCLALMTRSTPVAMAAVRCETLCSFARLITCAYECSRMRKSLSVTSDSVHRNACKPCTHSK